MVALSSSSSSSSSISSHIEKNWALEMNSLLNALAN